MSQSISQQTLAETISTIILSSDLTDKNQWIGMQDQIFNALNHAADILFETPDLDQVNSDFVTLHAVDRSSGQIIRRDLPLTLVENHNALRLIGEALDGSHSEIVFLSETASQKVVELTGHGQDKPRCK